MTRVRVSTLRNSLIRRMCAEAANEYSVSRRSCARMQWAFHSNASIQSPSQTWRTSHLSILLPYTPFSVLTILIVVPYPHLNRVCGHPRLQGGKAHPRIVHENQLASFPFPSCVSMPAMGWDGMGWNGMEQYTMGAALMSVCCKYHLVHGIRRVKVSSTFSPQFAL